MKKLTIIKNERNSFMNDPTNKRVGHKVKFVPQSVKNILPNEIFLQVTNLPGVYLIYFKEDDMFFIGHSSNVSAEIQSYLTGKGVNLAIFPLLTKEQTIYIFALYSCADFSLQEREIIEARLISFLPPKNALNKQNPKYNPLNGASVNLFQPKTKKKRQDLLPISFVPLDRSLDAIHPCLINTLYKPVDQTILAQKPKKVIYLFIHRDTKKFYVGYTEKFPAHFSGHRTTMRAELHKWDSKVTGLFINESHLKMALDCLNNPNGFYYTVLHVFQNETRKECGVLERIIQRYFIALLGQDLVYNNVTQINPITQQAKATPNALEKKSGDYLKRHIANIEAITKKKITPVYQKKFTINAQQAQSNIAIDLKSYPLLLNIDGNLGDLNPKLIGIIGEKFFSGGPNRHASKPTIFCLINKKNGKIYVNGSNHAKTELSNIRIGIQNVIANAQGKTVKQETNAAQTSMALDCLNGDDIFYSTILERLPNTGISLLDKQNLKDKILAYQQRFYQLIGDDLYNVTLLYSKN